MFQADLADEVGPAKAEEALPRWAWPTFAILFAMNMLDFMDRNVLFAVMPQLRDLPPTGLGIGPVRAGLLTTYFLLSYSIFGVFTGWAGDRMRRTWLLGLGVGVWSLATIGSGLARNYGQLALARGFLGIGEATYGVIAPTILLDLFPRRQRARVLSGFYLAMPIGSALGLGVGSALSKRFGWPSAFFVVGVPGLLAAFAALLLPEPVRGASEGVDPERLKAHEKAGASRRDYLDLMVNSSYTYAVGGMAFYTFAIGGMLAWVPDFLVKTRGIPQVRSGALLGLVTVSAAILGMSVGGWAADRLSRTDPKALFLVPGVTLLASVPFILVGLLAKGEVWIYSGIFLAETLMFVNTGPCNAVIANVVAPNMRATAYAVAILLTHLLGDMWSPALIGWVASTCGQPDTMASLVGQALASIGAVPTQAVAGGAPENFVAGLLIVVPAVAMAGLVLLAGARHLPREMALMQARLKAAPPGPLPVP